MNKILQLLMEDYDKQRPSAEYELALKSASDAERTFLASLDKTQKAEYLKLDFLVGIVCIIELDDLAKFLFENIRRL